MEGEKMWGVQWATGLWREECCVVDVAEVMWTRNNCCRLRGMTGELPRD